MPWDEKAFTTDAPTDMAPPPTSPKLPPPHPPCLPDWHTKPGTPCLGPAPPAHPPVEENDTNQVMALAVFVMCASVGVSAVIVAGCIVALKFREDGRRVESGLWQRHSSADRRVLGHSTHSQSVPEPFRFA